MVKKVPPPILPHPSKKILEKSKIYQCILVSKGKDMPSPPLSYAQAIYQASNILKIKEAFPALLDKKILEIHNAAFPKPINRGKKIQPTTKGPSRKQAIIPVSTKLTEVIMGEANSYIFQINTLLKNIKSDLQTEFICPFPGGLSINTNNIPNPSDLLTMEKYLKSIAGANNKEVLASQLPQSKLYLKITGIPFIQPNSNKLNSEDVEEAVYARGFPVFLFKLKFPNYCLSSCHMTENNH